MQIRAPRCERKNDDDLDEDAGDDEHEWMCDWQSLGWLCRCDIICAIGKFQIIKDVDKDDEGDHLNIKDADHDHDAGYEYS